MKPQGSLITIENNVDQIKRLLFELVLAPRLNAIRWSAITKQTPSIKIGYPGQHLASLITGMPGERTGARGNDLVDGSEVKSCSRIDQLDKCNNCESSVARMESTCPECGSAEIERKNDSKWLFTIRSEQDLRVLTHDVKRIVLVLGDYPNFDDNDFETLRFQSFEIWPESPRQHRFAEIMSNYYHKIFLEHRKQNSEKTPAPKNFWPYEYQFYLCNPILTFSCLIQNASTKPTMKVTKFIEPAVDRSKLPSEIMPSALLKSDELDLLLKNAKPSELSTMFVSKGVRKEVLVKPSIFPQKEKMAIFTGINETLRRYLPLRDTDRISVAKNTYARRRRT